CGRPAEVEHVLARGRKTPGGRAERCAGGNSPARAQVRGRACRYSSGAVSSVRRAADGRGVSCGRVEAERPRRDARGTESDPGRLMRYGMPLRYPATTRREPAPRPVECGLSATGATDG